MVNVGTKEIPKYIRLAQQIKLDILQGRLSPGDPIPSFAALRRDYGATPTTVERIISSLEREGLVERKQGKGTFVRPSRAQLGPKSASTLMRNSVAVLNLSTIDSRRRSDLAPGWADVILMGIMDALQRCSLHALAIGECSFADTVAADIVSLAPYGLLIPELTSTPEPYFRIARTVAGQGVPVVAYRGGDDLSDLDRVISDFESGSYELTKWLIERGRKRIINVWPAREDAYWYGERLAGYRRAMEEEGLAPLPAVLVPYLSHVPDMDETYESVRTFAGHMAQYLTDRDSVDAIMAVSDGSCPEIAAMLNLFHKEPNVDVDIVGYDNVGAQIVSPHLPKVLPLATVDKQNYVIGETLVKLLNDRCDGKLGRSPTKRMTPQRLVVLSSDNELK